MKIARMLGATAVLFVSLALFGSPVAFAAGHDSSGDSSGSSSSDSGSYESSSSGSSSGGDSSGGSSGGDSSGYSSSGHDSSGHDTSGGSNSCDEDCQRRKDEKKRKKYEPEPSAVLVVPQNPTPRAPVRQYTPAAPPAQDFVPPAPAETPVLEQDAVSRGSGELLPSGASVPVADSSPTADTTPDTEDGEAGAGAPSPQLTAEAQASAGGGTSPPWALIGGGLAIGLLGAGLAFAPSRKPPLPPPPPMNPTSHYPGY